VGSSPTAGTDLFNDLRRKAGPLSCAIVAQFFDFLHCGQRDRGHFLNIVLLRCRHARVSKEALGRHRIFLNAVQHRRDAATQRVVAVPRNSRFVECGPDLAPPRLSRSKGFADGPRRISPDAGFKSSSRSWAKIERSGSIIATGVALSAVLGSVTGVLHGIRKFACRSAENHVPFRAPPITAAPRGQF